MILDQVQIKNFRSIQDTTIKFAPPCRVLVGINESGKSNILRAMALLDDDIKPHRNTDLREALPDESTIEHSHVWFIFRFEKNESDILYESVLKQILTSAKNPEIVSSGETRYRVKEFCATRNQGLYIVNILKETKYFTSWTLPEQHQLIDGWKKPTTACPSDYATYIKDKSYNLADYKFVRAKDFPDVPELYLEDATIDDLSQLIRVALVEITKDALPDTLFWEYDEDNLLPNSIKIDAFINDPLTCIPLQNMFLLSGITDIKIDVQVARKGTDNQFQNYLDRIARKTTAHFKSVWKEYKNIEFSLRFHSDFIVPGIKETNVHDFERRSDGFKRFVTFLLLISVKVKVQELHNTLLLID